jgi:hypothetical protein
MLLMFSLRGYLERYSLALIAYLIISFFDFKAVKLPVSDLSLNFKWSYGMKSAVPKKEKAFLFFLFVQHLLK